MPKRLDFTNGEPEDADSNGADGDRPDLPDKRCSVCGWTGPDDDAYDQRCPRCGYGVVGFNVRWADTVDDDTTDADDDADEIYEYYYGAEGSE